MGKSALQKGASTIRRVQPGDSGHVYVNEDVVHTTVQFNANDIVEVGKSELVLVAFATEKYKVFD